MSKYLSGDDLISDSEFVILKNQIQTEKSELEKLIQRMILNLVGSDCILKDGKLRVELKKLFHYVFGLNQSIQSIRTEQQQDLELTCETVNAKKDMWLGVVEEVRNVFMVKTFVLTQS